MHHTQGEKHHRDVAKSDHYEDDKEDDHSATLNEQEERSEVIKVLLYELNNAISEKQARVFSLSAALDEFNHNDTLGHDEELSLQADQILFQKLSLASVIDPMSEEVGMICSGLEMVYRASKPGVTMSFERVGLFMLPLLIGLIWVDGEGGDGVGDLEKNEEKKSDDEDDEDTEGCVKKTSPVAMTKILKILRYFSRVLSAMIPMAHQPHLIDALISQLRRKHDIRRHVNAISDIQSHTDLYRTGKSKKNETDGDKEKQSSWNELKAIVMDEVAESRVDAMATLVNLACAEENKVMMAYHPRLLDVVVDVANKDDNDEVREHAAIVLMNLCYADENKIYMASQDKVLDTLSTLIRGNNDDDDDDNNDDDDDDNNDDDNNNNPKTRQYASAALFTLACVVANTGRIITHSDGMILTALVRVLLNDPLEQARMNSAEALFSLCRNQSANSGEDHVADVEVLGNHPELLVSLSRAILVDQNADIRGYCARALEWLASDIHHPMSSHKTLLNSLITASKYTQTTCIAEAFKTQSTLSANRKAMSEHPGLLDSLAMLASLDDAHGEDFIRNDEIRTAALSAIERLSLEPSARRVMVRNEGIMTALTRASFSEGGMGYDDDGSDEKSHVSSGSRVALKNISKAM